MSNAPTQQAAPSTTMATPTISYRLGQWLQDPMGSVVAASAAVISSFGLVISGMWAINVAIN